jgi:hypothetical protein
MSKVVHIIFIKEVVIIMIAPHNSAAFTFQTGIETIVAKMDNIGSRSILKRGNEIWRILIPKRRNLIVLYMKKVRIYCNMHIIQ